LEEMKRHSKKHCLRCRQKSIEETNFLWGVLFEGGWELSSAHIVERLNSFHLRPERIEQLHEDQTQGEHVHLVRVRLA
jgi:hypothetical protein